MKRLILAGAALAGLLLATASANAADKLLNASYDVGRELFVQINKAFVEQHPGVTIDQSHAGTSKLARSIVDGLGAVPGLRVAAPRGSFFAWIGVAGLIGQVRPDGGVIADDGDVVDWLLEAEGVAVVRGAAYGLSPYLRLSFAASDAKLAEAVTRIGRAVAALRPAALEAAA